MNILKTAEEFVVFGNHRTIATHFDLNQLFKALEQTISHI